MALGRRLSVDTTHHCLFLFEEHQTHGCFKLFRDVDAFFPICNQVTAAARLRNSVRLVQSYCFEADID